MSQIFYYPQIIFLIHQLYLTYFVCIIYTLYYNGFMMLTLNVFLFPSRKKKWMSLKAKLTDRDLNTAVKLHCQPCNKF